MKYFKYIIQRERERKRESKRERVMCRTDNVKEQMVETK